MAPQLRLTSAAGVEVLARLVYRGDRYGAGRQLVNTGWQTLIEFALPRGAGEQMVAVYNVDDLPVDIAGWKPGGVAQLEMTGAETDRLVRWIQDPDSDTEVVVLLVGDEEDLDKASVALKRLSLATKREADGQRALQHARTIAPAVIVVGRDTGALSPAEVVRKLGASEDTRDVPVVLFGVPENGANGASLHVEARDFAALAAGVSELLDLV
jgi:CheY-like chemotaxis protein